MKVRYLKQAFFDIMIFLGDFFWKSLPAASIRKSNTDLFSDWNIIEFFILFFVSKKKITNFSFGKTKSELSFYWLKGGAGGGFILR